MRILKFGGKSLSTPKKVQNVCKYIQKIYKKDKNLIVVVSAMGQTTDNLIVESKLYCTGNALDRELDVLLSTGETKSSALISIMLNHMGVPARSLQGWQIELSTFGAHQYSQIAYINKEKFMECFENHEVAVVAGFQGINKNGDITTLGRGGSDTTACALGAIFGINTEIYSDFDGVFAGDPRLLNFKKIKSISSCTMKNLSKCGAKVIDERAVSIAKKFNLDIISKSSSAPHRLGTTISNIEDDIIAISSKDDLCEISIVFSNISKSKIIIKNVINEINKFDFYNFSVDNSKICFIINKTEKLKIIEMNSLLQLLFLFVYFEKIYQYLFVIPS